jgi:GNAT superfamily N-acetyltransferase
MVTIEKVDTNNKNQVRQFVEFQYELYRPCKQWVPPVYDDVYLSLNREKHPFFEHSDVDFFLALRDGKVVGRVSVFENKPYNKYHKSNTAGFCYFDSIDDQEVADALFQEVFNWANVRGLDEIVGSKPFSALDGYGILIEGFEHRQMMSMANYNYPYYQRLLENIGFEKAVDFISAYLNIENFRVPERIHRIAGRTQERGTFTVKRFKNKKELISWADRIGEAYNKTMVNNWEYYPLSPHEVQLIVDNIMVIADHRLFKIILHGDEIVGYLLAFHDVSAGLQKARGRLFPFGIFHLLLALKTTKWVAVNGIGILPEYQGHGGNALVYSEMEKTVRDFGFVEADCVNIADTAVQMRSDLVNVGAKIYKRHRVYKKII